MRNLLHPDIIKILYGFYYRFRFIGIYIVIGVLSLLIELTVRSQLLLINFHLYLATIISLTVGILFAFFGNVYFNFKVPPSRRNRAFIYFTIISVFSGIIQWFVVSYLMDDDQLSYEQARLFISGAMFIIGYVLHKRFTFRDFKRVGVAIYANGVEDLQRIHQSIGQYPDFIHVDIVDTSFSPEAKEIKAYRMETIRALWQNHEVHTHIMSKKPSDWLHEVLPYSDTIYVHIECEEDIKKIIEFIKQKDKKAGIAICMDTTINEIEKILGLVDSVLLLAIPEPGHSGQSIDMQVLDRIDSLNASVFRDKIRICIDGGVNEKVVGLLKVEDVVSGSSVLDHNDPKRQILVLQSDGYY